MAIAAHSIVLPFPTKRKAPVKNPKYVEAKDFPPNCIRLERKPEWVLVSASLAYNLRYAGHTL